MAKILGSEALGPSSLPHLRLLYYCWAPAITSTSISWEITMHRYHDSCSLNILSLPKTLQGWCYQPTRQMRDHDSWKLRYPARTQLGEGAKRGFEKPAFFLCSLLWSQYRNQTLLRAGNSRAKEEPRPVLEPPNKTRQSPLPGSAVTAHKLDVVFIFQSTVQTGLFVSYLTMMCSKKMEKI